jgi:hypothetical protein
MDALLIEMSSPSPPPKTSNAETFTTIYYWRDGGMITKWPQCRDNDYWISKQMGQQARWDGLTTFLKWSQCLTKGFTNLR